MKKESMISNYFVNWSRRMASKILGRNLLLDSVPFLEMSEEKGCNLEILLRKRIFYLQGRGNPIRIFSKEELNKGTNNFSTHHLPHEGIFQFYKGILHDHKVVVQVPTKISYNTMVEEVIVEAVILSSISHKNVVKFLGCCLETKYPILVYEFIPNCRTLKDCISDQMLPWSDRFRIATEVAEAVNYLHIHSSIAIVHRDIKTNNILLDEHHTAKLSGFSLLFPMPPGKKIAETERFAGTYYYVDPEYMRTGDLNEKSDVYGYGVVLLQLLTGRSLGLKDDFSLVKEFVSHMEEGRVADILESWVVTEGRMEQIQALAEVALECVCDEREERPTMKEVVEKLWAIRKML